MFRGAILTLLIAFPSAHAQDSGEEGRKLADAFTQTDLDTLGGCQARVEGMGRLVDEFQVWLQQQGYTEALAGIRDARDKGGDVIARFDELCTQLGSPAGGVDIVASEAARTAVAATFQRRPGESDLDTYNRWRTATTLPQDCRDAMKRARWRVELEALGQGQ